MSAVEVTFYRLRCDEPGCTAALYPDGPDGFPGWENADDTRENAKDSDDWDTADAALDRDYCQEHSKPTCDFCGARATFLAEDAEQALCAEHTDDEETS